MESFLGFVIWVLIHLLLFLLWTVPEDLVSVTSAIYIYLLSMGSVATKTMFIYFSGAISFSFFLCKMFPSLDSTSISSFYRFSSRISRISVKALMLILLIQWKIFSLRKWKNRTSAIFYPVELKRKVIKRLCKQFYRITESLKSRLYPP